MSRRTSIEIVIDILQKCKRPMYFSYLMGEAHLSFSQAKQYLHRLVNAGYLKETHRGRTIQYKLTNKGKQTLEALKPALEIIGEVKT